MVVADPEAAGGERAKILDFGLAKLTEPEAGAPGLTNTGTILGTPAYMAPEQCKSARAADDRSDVYSLGIILYEMLTADIPFDAETDAELLSMHMFQEPPSLAKRAPHLSLGLAQLVHRMLRKEPSTRPSAGDVAAELAQLLAAGSGGLPASTFSAPSRALGPEPATLITPPAGPPPPLLELATPVPMLQLAGKERLRGKSTLWQATLWLLATILLLSCAGVGVLLWFRRQQALPPTPPPTVRWSVSSIPPAAELVDVDGHSLGSTPLSLDRPRGEGSVTMILRRAGFADLSLTLPLALDAVRSEHLVALPQLAPAAAVDAAVLSAVMLASPDAATSGSDEPPPSNSPADGSSD